MSELFSPCVLVLTFTTISMSNLTFITLNCRGLRTADNRATLFQWANCAKTDFVCLQEAHSISEEEFSSWLDHATSSGCNKFGYKCISSPGTIFGRFSELILSMSLILLIIMDNCLPRSDLGLSRSSISVGIVLI